MDLTWCFPQPVPIAVGGRELFAGPLRLRDLARLQGYLAVARPSPLESARAAIADATPGSEARRRLLRDAYRACQSWPVRLGSPEAAEAFATPEGLRFWLAVALAEHNPGLSADDLGDLCERITVEEYLHLSRVCHGSAPLDELNRLIAPDCFEAEGEAKPLNWGRLLAELAEQTGWTFEQLGELRVTQLAAIRTKGEAGSPKVEPPKGMGRFAFARRQRAFFGPDREED